MLVIKLKIFLKIKITHINSIPSVYPNRLTKRASIRQSSISILWLITNVCSSSQQTKRVSASALFIYFATMSPIRRFFFSSLTYKLFDYHFLFSFWFLLEANFPPIFVASNVQKSEIYDVSEEYKDSIRENDDHRINQLVYYIWLLSFHKSSITFN